MRNLSVRLSFKSAWHFFLCHKKKRSAHVVVFGTWWLVALHYMIFAFCATGVMMSLAWAETDLYRPFGDPQETALISEPWAEMKVFVGSSTCWAGDAVQEYLDIVRTEDGGANLYVTLDDERRSKPLYINRADLDNLCDTLTTYCLKFIEEERHLISGTWMLLHEIKIRPIASTEFKTIYRGASFFQEPLSEEFHVWLRKIHPEGYMLSAEKFWVEKRKTGRKTGTQ